MNKHLLTALSQRHVRGTTARLLSRWPALLGYVETPSQEPFLALVLAITAAEPDTPTRCDGWTVHALTAHLTAGSQETADLTELELAGSPRRATRDFEEREAPYRAMNPQRLRRRFFEEALRATVALERLAATKQQVFFTGTFLNASALTLHIESELVLHRWDIVGSDETSVRALSDPRIGVHAVSTVASMRPNVFPPRTGNRETVILRSAGQPDIAVSGGSSTTIELADALRTGPVVQCHPAVRNLMLWGRWPADGLPDPIGDTAAVDAVTAMLAPRSAMPQKPSRRPVFSMPDAVAGESV